MYVFYCLITWMSHMVVVQAEKWRHTTNSLRLNHERLQAVVSWLALPSRLKPAGAAGLLNILTLVIIQRIRLVAASRHVLPTAVLRWIQQQNHRCWLSDRVSVCKSPQVYVCSDGFIVCMCVYCVSARVLLFYGRMLSEANKINK